MKAIKFYDINLRLKGVHTWSHRIPSAESMENGSIADITATQLSALYQKDNGDYVLYFSDNKADFNYKERDCNFVEFTELV